MVESLEGRRLLSNLYSTPSGIKPIQTPSGTYMVSVDGPGLVNIRPMGRGQVGVVVYGSTNATTLSVNLVRQRYHRPAAPLNLASIDVISGTIGAINAPSAALQGAVSPLLGASSINFGLLGPNARIDVNGSLANLALGAVNLGPTGHVQINGSLGQSLSVAGPVRLDGAVFSIAGELAGALSLGSLDVTRNGRFLVGKDVSGAGQIGGNLSITENGLVAIGQSLAGLSVGGNLSLDTGGQFLIGKDLSGQTSVAGDFLVSHDAQFTVARDVATGSGSIAVGGDLKLANDGSLVVGRDLNGLNVNGDVIVDPSGGLITVGYNLNALGVNGIFRGKGTTTPDLAVGLDLRNTVIRGGTPNEGGLQRASIDVGKNIVNVDVSHGIFNSFVTAGVLIDNFVIGSDPADSVLNSDIRAGVRIDHTTLGGNVRSTFATDPNSSGYATRIVAGQNRAGVFETAGVIDNFQILGTLFDGVVAASVAPNGGDGTLPTDAYGVPPRTCSDTPGDGGNNTYDAPAGTITAGSLIYNNYTQLAYKDGMLVGVAYNTTLDPTIDDCILFGSINPSFASDVIPTKSTVLGGVISTIHGDEADFAGLYAADTKGVFIGRIPDN